MKHIHPAPQNTLATLISLAAISLTVPYTALAQTVDLGTVGGSTGSGAASTPSMTAEKGTAASVAPTQANLQATQPQSIISRTFIEESVAPTGNFNTIITIAPSIATQPAPNGPGLGDTKSTMRGFVDGQYNVTFDGIPFGDANDPTHHSTSYFPAAVLGGVVIERGPGNASNLGQSTYGGSINLLSKVPSSERKFSVYSSIGNWNTNLEGVSYESGRLQNYGDATVQLNYQHLTSDGYLQNNKIKSDNFMFKFQRPVGDASLLTLFAAYNDVATHVTDNASGPTLAQAAKFGKNYSMNNDPASQGFVDYNRVSKQTDFEYARLQTAWESGWETDNNFYTYYYKNYTVAGADPTGYSGSTTLAAGSVANGVKVNGVSFPNDIPGNDKLNQYRVIGNILKATKKSSTGLLRVGLWYETAESPRGGKQFDLSQNVVTSVKYDQHSSWKQYQPFAEYEWLAAPGLTVTPGIKYMNFTRSVNAAVNQTTGVPANFSQTYRSTLPFLTVNKLINPELSVYAQYAKGLQVPALASLQVIGSTNSPTPQITTNYQMGVVGKSDRFTWDADLYYINFDNMIGSSVVNGQTTFFNAGGAVYKGLEAQGTYVIGAGFSAYANGSINNARYSANNAMGNVGRVEKAPATTAAFGALYNDGPLSATLIYKRTGSFFAFANEPSAYLIGSYGNTDLNISRTFNNTSMLGIKAIKLQLSVFNLMNKQSVTAIAKGKSVALDQYQWQAPRSLMVSAKLDL